MSYSTTANINPAPNSLEAERRVLAAIINDPESFSEINPECFYQESHRQIYRTMRSEKQKGNSPDIFSVSNLLPEYKEDLWEIERLGGFNAIAADRNLKCICGLYEKRKTLEFLKLASGKLEEGLPLGDVVPGLIASIELKKTDPHHKALASEAVSEWIMKDIPKPASIIDGLIDAGTKIDLSASSKAGKSWFVNQLCVCVATGRDFLGYKLYGIRRKVLILNLEIGNYFFQSRLRSTMEALDVSLDEIEGTLFV
ncbi:MAG: AAA family ATPase, partial [Lentisphaerota bacterium]